MNKRTLLSLRFILILTAILVMTFSKKGLNMASPGYAVALIYFISNVIFYRIPDQKFAKPFITFLIFLSDIICISLAIYFIQGMQTDFYLIYFLIIFIASVGQDVRGSIPIAVVASIIYGWLIYRANPGMSILDSAILIRIPFLFIISLISSYWSSSFRRQLKDKASLEHFARELKKEVARKTVQETELRQYSETIINSFSSGVIAVRTDGTITTLNPEAERILGAEEGEFVEKNMKGMPGLDALWKKMEESINSGIPFERVEVLINNKRNENVPIGVSISPTTTADKRFSGCVAIFKDLSDVKELEEKLKHAERLSYLGKMASWVAHEIRNPLTAIDGFSQLLENADDKEKIRMFSAEIHKGTQRINHIIEDILTFARTKSKVEYVEINLREIIESITKNIKNALVIITGKENPIIKGEIESMQSLFVNLINNSVEAMDKNCELNISFTEAKDWLITEIIDNGKGISEENMKNLFTPFFTTKRRGTGLGLAIVKKILDDHNGDIKIESIEGVGTKCCVYLPKGRKVD